MDFFSKNLITIICSISFFSSNCLSAVKESGVDLMKSRVSSVLEKLKKEKLDSIFIEMKKDNSFCNGCSEEEYKKIFIKVLANVFDEIISNNNSSIIHSSVNGYFKYEKDNSNCLKDLDENSNLRPKKYSVVNFDNLPEGLKLEDGKGKEELHKLFGNKCFEMFKKYFTENKDCHYFSILKTLDSSNVEKYIKKINFLIALYGHYIDGISVDESSNLNVFKKFIYEIFSKEFEKMLKYFFKINLISGEGIETDCFKCFLKLINSIDDVGIKADLMKLLNERKDTDLKVISDPILFNDLLADGYYLGGKIIVPTGIIDKIRSFYAPFGSNPKGYIGSDVFYIFRYEDDFKKLQEDLICLGVELDKKVFIAPKKESIKEVNLNSELIEQKEFIEKNIHIDTENVVKKLFELFFNTFRNKIKSEMKINEKEDGVFGFSLEINVKNFNLKDDFIKTLKLPFGFKDRDVNNNDIKDYYNRLIDDQKRKLLLEKVDWFLKTALFCEDSIEIIIKKIVEIKKLAGILWDGIKVSTNSRVYDFLKRLFTTFEFNEDSFQKVGREGLPLKIGDKIEEFINSFFVEKDDKSVEKYKKELLDLIKDAKSKKIVVDFNKQDLHKDKQECSENKDPLVQEVKKAVIDISTVTSSSKLELGILGSVDILGALSKIRLSLNRGTNDKYDTYNKIFSEFTTSFDAIFSYIQSNKNKIDSLKLLTGIFAIINIINLIYKKHNLALNKKINLEGKNLCKFDKVILVSDYILQILKVAALIYKKDLNNEIVEFFDQLILIIEGIKLVKSF